MPSDMDDEIDDIEGAEGVSPPPSIQNGTATPKPRVPRARSRGESQTQEARGGIGIGRIPSTGVKGLDKPFENHDAEFLWPEVLERLRENGRSEYQCTMRVVRISPGERAILTSIPCEALLGDESINPGDALIRKVTDEVHLQTAQWPATYDCIFVWKINGQILTRGQLRLPAPAQIHQQREAEARRLAASGTPGTGYGAPHFQMQPMPQPMPYSPSHQGDSSEVARLREELRLAQAREIHNQGVLEEIRRANAEGREPRIPPGFGAPPPSLDLASIEDRLTRRLEDGLLRIADALSGGRVGLGHQQPAPAVPPPPPPPAPAPVDPLVAMSQRLTQKMLERTLERVAVSMEKSMDALDNANATGLGAPDTSQEPETPLAPATPPADEKPWVGVKSEFGTWSDGRPVIFPKAKEGGIGGVHPVGALFENPIIAETLMGGLNNLMESTADAIKRVASGESPHVRRVGPMPTTQVQPQQLPPQGGGKPPGGSGFDE